MTIAARTSIVGVVVILAVATLALALPNGSWPRLPSTQLDDQRSTEHPPGVKQLIDEVNARGIEVKFCPMYPSLKGSDEDVERKRIRRLLESEASFERARGTTAP